MIYCIEIDLYPKEGQYIEEISYLDENNFEWRICRIENGFMVKYFGDDYFRESVFDIELSNGKNFRIKNTNCIFFKDSNFDTFCNVRDILKNGFTDEIWEAFESCFKVRFEINDGFIESEIV